MRHVIQFMSRMSARLRFTPHMARLSKAISGGCRRAWEMFCTHWSLCLSTTGKKYYLEQGAEVSGLKAASPHIESVNGQVKASRE